MCKVLFLNINSPTKRTKRTLSSGNPKRHIEPITQHSICKVSKIFQIPRNKDKKIIKVCASRGVDKGDYGDRGDNGAFPRNPRK